MWIDIHRDDQLSLVWYSWSYPKYFKRRQKKQQIVTEISIRCNQAHLDMLVMNVQYIQNRGIK